MLAGKRALRRALLARWLAVPPADAQAASAAVCARLTTVPALQALGHVVVFAALPYELDLGAWVDAELAAGRRVYYPRYQAAVRGYELVAVRHRGSDLVAGFYGIAEPRPDLPAGGPPPAATDVAWLVPGVAFDAAGARLGRGAGHYDRLLAASPGVRVGVAYDWQFLPLVPTSAHDVPMDWVVTDARSVRCDHLHAPTKEPAV